MKEITKKWFERAEQDLLVVEKIVDIQKVYDLSVFHLQQALEKALKGYIQEKLDIEPPKIHNLVGLLNLSELTLDEKNIRLLEDLNYLYLETRYPSSQQEVIDYFAETNIYEVYNNIKELVKWTKNKL
ncbi:MAG: hypothetical protein A3I68_03080 [Candidatus Melainabacteria bacterium RIFCSPLOWO2_02_FULL_35_15]|nr:MAG: hypothetical protein A3I68_03080 [Candidatus Melainabacteria bacterium RIFCSPLOWO2_02_FULL_35_15]